MMLFREPLSGRLYSVLSSARLRRHGVPRTTPVAAVLVFTLCVLMVFSLAQSNLVRTSAAAPIAPPIFLPASNYAVGATPVSVAVGDFNGDKKLDLVAANGDGNVSVLLGNGDGSFQAAVSYPASSEPRALAVGDFNGDGKLDLVVANGEGGVSLLLNQNQSARFQHTTTGFPLTGAHLTLQCNQCHVYNVFVGTPTACVNCLLTDYNYANNPPHKAAGFPQDCSLCHSTTDWTGATFHHPIAPLAITGAHITVACLACHINNVFAGTPTACINCHLTDYNNANNPNHRAAGFPTTCDTCHQVVAGWAGATFVHPTTPLALTGAHITVACLACHINNVFAGTPTACINCHLTD